MSDGYRGPDSSDSPIFTSRRRRGGSNDAVAIVALVVGGLIVAVGLVWWFFGRTSELPPITGSVGADSAATESLPAVSDSQAVVSRLPWDSLPSLDASDAFVRERGSSLTGDPLWDEWLGGDDLVERAVVTVASLSAGLSPAEQLPFLQPRDTFTVIERDGRTYLDPASYRRYDAMTRVISSVDIGLAARMYRGLAPLLEAAWQPLGFGDAGFDTGLARALGVILSVDVQDRPLELQQSGVVWEYADPDLEALSAAEKHVLRLGPENARRLQAQARALANALGIQPVQPR